MAKTVLDIELTADHERCLREQAFSDVEPGALLHDFQLVLDFVRFEPRVEAAGKYNLLPIKYIDELDRCLERPLNLEMKRPLLKSHPYLLGLNLLLRASGLSRVEGAGAKVRLVVDSEMFCQWDQLNPTERYFNLLEAWLRIGRAEMVGEESRSWDTLLSQIMQAWHRVPGEGTRFDIDTPSHVYLGGINRAFYQLALMDLFGLLEVEHPGRPVMPWCPAGVKRRPFGDALFTLLSTRFGFLGLGKLGQEEKNDDESDVPRFGAWQSLFQPYFPEWRENLQMTQAEPREGTFVFRVSLGKVWRLIAMPSDATLDDFVDWILRSVKFDHDHLYQFTYRDGMGATIKVSDPETGEAPWTDDVEIGTLPLEPGQTMDLLYDYGDNWNFTIKLVRIEPPGAKIKAPRIIESHGKTPEQYPRWDE